MPRFNPRAGGFTDGVQINYRSYFKPDCPNEYDENPRDKQPYNDQAPESQYEKTDYYNLPRYRTRPKIFTQSKIHNFFLRKKPNRTFQKNIHTEPKTYQIMPA
jgi:hypothetical protein